MSRSQIISQSKTSETPAAITAFDAAVTAKSDLPARRKGFTTALFSLTSICFLFGALLAFGARSIQAVRNNETEAKASLALQQNQLEAAQKELAREAKARKELESNYETIKKKIATEGKVSQAQARKLGVEMKKLQALLGLTPVTGRGIVVRLSDNPQAAKDAGPDAGPFLPGIVHDFDLLQVVNELRSAKAEAISINGVRVTGFTPIRCVGPTIYINYEPKPAPFIVEAIGDADDLQGALSMPGGILENLKNQTLGVRISEDTITLPAATGVPELKVAKVD